MNVLKKLNLRNDLKKILDHQAHDNYNGKD